MSTQFHSWSVNSFTGNSIQTTIPYTNDGLETVIYIILGFVLLSNQMDEATGGDAIVIRNKDDILRTLQEPGWTPAKQSLVLDLLDFAFQRSVFQEKLNRLI